MLHRRTRRFQCPRGIEKRACREFLQEIWGLDWDPKRPYANIPPGPYIDFWANCVQQINDETLVLEDRNVAISLVQIVRSSLHETTAQLIDKVNGYLTQRSGHSSHSSANQAWEASAFAIQLWLHMRPDPNWRVASAQTLHQLVQAKLPEAAPQGTVITGKINLKLSAQELSRACGISVVWTDDFCQHLALTGRNMHVFRHAALLPVFRNMAGYVLLLDKADSID